MNMKPCTWDFDTLLELTPEQIKYLLLKGVKFEAKLEELLEDPVMLLHVTVYTYDAGIGGYEFWGFHGVDKQIAHEVESITCEGVEMPQLTEEQKKELDRRIQGRAAAPVDAEPDYDFDED